MKTSQTITRSAIPVLLLLLAGMLTACNDAGNQSSNDKTTRLHDISTPGESTSMDQPEKAEPMNLQVTPAMMDEVFTGTGATDDVAVNTQSQGSLDLNQKKTESRVKVKGEVYYDANQENYMDALDGGKIDVEIRFRE